VPPQLVNDKIKNLVDGERIAREADVERGTKEKHHIILWIWITGRGRRLIWNPEICI
jgi:hypothetical protein